MSDDFLARNDGPVYTPPPEDNYSSVCVGVYNLGLQETKFGPKHQVFLNWQIDLEKEDGSRHVVGNKYTLSLYELATFRKMVEAWFGTKITPEQEKEGIDPRKFLGKPCLLQIIHAHGTGAKANRVYANVGAVTKLMKGIQPLEPNIKLTSYSFSDGLNIPEETPKYVAQLIQKSRQWMVLQNQANRANNDDGAPHFAADDAVDDGTVPF